MNTKTVDLGSKGSFSIHPGGLHRALGVPEGQKIPAKKLQAALNSGSAHVRKMADLAKAFRGMK
jgi:hypothetical protein